jgi:hypothetical protein
MVAIYLTGFILQFDVLGSPLRGHDGWLGPRIRGDANAVDIGKVWFHEMPDTELYRGYQPLCQAWLWLEGLSLGI